MPRKRYAKWNYERFLEEIKDPAFDSFSYVLVKPEHIKKVKSIINIICKICDYDWKTTITNHFNKRSGCPDCMGKVPWTYTKMLRRIKQFNLAERFDYSLVIPENIKGAQSWIRIICRICGYNWEITVDNHFNQRPDALIVLEKHHGLTNVFLIELRYYRFP